MATTLAIIAIAISVFAAGFTGWDAWSDRRSAKAAEVSAEAAKRSAEYARQSAQSAAQVAQADAERAHDARRPDLETSGSFDTVRSEQLKNSGWVYSFTLPRSYRAHVDAINGNGSRTSLGIYPSNVIPAGHVHRVHLGDAAQPLPGLIEFRFWPPEVGDSGEHWTCPCSRPEHQGDHDSEAHWVVRVPVRKPPEVLVAWA